MIKIFLVLLLLFYGCAAQKPQPSVALLDGISKEGAPICLSESSGIPKIVRKFFQVRDLTTEEGKIDYLIERVRTSRVTFYRNKVEYNAQASAEFLRWKMNRWKTRYHTKIDTAQDFVTKIVAGSKMSGKPYEVILSDGSRHNFQSVMQNELNALETCLKEYAASESESQEVRSDLNVATTPPANQKS
ncbi:MAG: DUF5329 family protein [Candidatus Omnitrophica bacterium]|nr:DUF5329 family protein [Candidatus Omnitrophota bacterium]